MPSMPQESLEVVEVKRKLRPKRTRKPPEKRLTLKQADARFSSFVRSRDKFCQFQGCMVSDPAKLQCSHYIGRAKLSTRFDPNNCIALCWFHHFKSKDLGLEYQKQTYEKHGWDGQYTLLMRKRLGEKKFKELISKSHKSVKLRYAIAELESWIYQVPKLTDVWPEPKYEE